MHTHLSRADGIALASLVAAAFGTGWAVGNAGEAKGTPGETENKELSSARVQVIRAYSDGLSPNPHKAELQGVSWACDRFIGVGTLASDSDSDGDWGRWAPRVWTSTDGSRWELVPYDKTWEDGDPFNSSMRGVTRGPEDTFVAVGTSWHGSPIDREAAAWKSTDGLTWTRVDSESFTRAQAQSLEGLPYAQHQYLAVGHDDDDAAIWASSDGVNWRRLKVAAFDDVRGEQFLGDITFAKGQWVAVGADSLTDVGDVASPDDDDATDAAVWTSSDGQTREKQTGPDVGKNGSQKLEGACYNSSAELWIVVGQDRSLGNNGAVWTSSDLSTWQRFNADSRELSGAETIALKGVSCSTDTWVGVGIVAPRDGERPISGEAWIIKSDSRTSDSPQP
jgi:hypothetical protein